MRFLPLALLLAALLPGPAEAGPERAALVARSQAMGGAYVSLADDVSAIFVNPAGLALAGRFAAEAEYSGPHELYDLREARVAVSGSRGATGAGAGWYFGGNGVGTGDHLIAAGVARRLFGAGESSFISIGANGVLTIGDTGGSRCSTHGLCLDAPSGRSFSADLGVIARPLPVVSFGYAAANLFDARSNVAGKAHEWHRAQRWGASYFWENRLVVSFAGETMEGKTTYHYGIRLKTAVPIELMSGFSNGRAAGGVAWSSARFEAVAAFSSEEGGVVRWTGAIEIRLPEGAGAGAR